MSQKEIREIIDGLLSLQSIIIKNEPWIIDETKGDIGNVAQIEIYDSNGVYPERLKLVENYKIVRTDEKPIHKISMHIDTLIDLLSGDIDFGEAYLKGLVKFEGKDFHIHAMKWSKAIKRLRKYLNPTSRR